MISGLAILVLACALAAQQSQPTTDTRLFPFRLGAVFVYRDTETGRESQLICSRHVCGAEGAWLGVMHVQNGGSSIEFWREQDGVLLRRTGQLARGQLVPTGPVQRLADSEPRWSWSEPEPGREGTPLVHAGKRSGDAVRLRTAFGERLCRATTITTTRGSEVLRTTTLCLAPGVGLVRMTTMEPRTGKVSAKELVRVQPGMSAADEQLALRVGALVDAQNARAPNAREYLMLELMGEPEVLAFPTRRFFRVLTLDGGLVCYSAEGESVESADLGNRPFWSALAATMKEPQQIAGVCAIVAATLQRVQGSAVDGGSIRVLTEPDGTLTVNAAARGKTAKGAPAACEVQLRLRGTTLVSARAIPR